MGNFSKNNYGSIISLDGKSILLLFSTILLSIVIVIIIANRIRDLEVIISALENRVAVYRLMRIQLTLTIFVLLKVANIKYK
jgi:hypothetical protein